MCILRFSKRLNETNYIKWVFDYYAADEKRTNIGKSVLNIHEYFMEKKHK